MTATATKKTLTGEYMELPLDQLHPSPDNPRRDVGDVVELATSIKSMGILEPLVVTPNGNGFIVVAGHRRLAAAELAALDTVPCVVRTFDDRERIAAMLVENLQRSDLQPIEEATAYRRLIDEFQFSQRDLAEKVGRSQGHISKRLSLVELPANICKALDSGGITVGDALELARLKDMPKRQAAAFSTGTQWRGQYARAVQDQINAHELAEKIGKAEQELKQKGIKIVQFGGHYGELKGGAKQLDDWSIRDLKLTVANHKDQPCHAAAINPREGRIVWCCTKPASHKGKKLETPADEKEKARKERERQHAAALRAREQNIALGLALDAKLSSPKIDAESMKLIADLLLMEIGTDLAHSSFKFTDDDSQTVIEKKDGSISRIAHVEGNASRQLLDERMAEAKTAEEIMGVLLQALVATRYVNRDAVPQSQRWPDVRGIYRGGYSNAERALRGAIEKIARKHGVVAVPAAKSVDATHECPAPPLRGLLRARPGCKVRVNQERLACGGHWYAIPLNLREKLLREYSHSFGETSYFEARAACLRALGVPEHEVAPMNAGVA